MQVHAGAILQGHSPVGQTYCEAERGCPGAASSDAVMQWCRRDRRQGATSISRSSSAEYHGMRERNFLHVGFGCLNPWLHPVFYPLFALNPFSMNKWIVYIESCWRESHPGRQLCMISFCCTAIWLKGQVPLARRQIWGEKRALSICYWKAPLTSQSGSSPSLCPLVSFFFRNSGFCATCFGIESWETLYQPIEGSTRILRVHITQERQEFCKTPQHCDGMLPSLPFLVMNPTYAHLPKGRSSTDTDFAHSLSTTVCELAASHSTNTREHNANWESAPLPIFSVDNCNCLS